MNKPGISRRNIEDAFPLSAIQQGMVYHSIQHPEKSLYHNQMIIQLQDRAFDPAVFQSALTALSRRHGMLRTGFLKNKRGERLQVVQLKTEPEYSHRDLSGLERGEQEDEIRRFLETDRTRPFDLSEGGLLWRAHSFDLGDGEVCLVWICHHAMIDGWSSATLVTELNNAYLRLKRDPEFTLPPLQSTYKLYVAEQLAQTGDPAALEFWRRELVGYRRFSFPQPLESDSGERRHRKIVKTLGGRLRSQLEQGSKDLGLSVKSMCFSAYMGALSMFSHHNDITAGLVTNNRPVCADAERMIGCFLNTVPVRLQTAWGVSWLDMTRIVDAALVRIKAFDMIPLIDIAQAVGEIGRDRNPICDVIFNFVDFFVYNQAQGGLLQESSRRLAVRGAGDTNTLLDVSVESTGKRFELALVFSPQFVDKPAVESFAYYFEAILHALINRPHERSGKVALLDPAEKHLVLETFNQTDTPFPIQKTIPELLKEQALRHPDRIASCALSAALSYKEFWRRALGLAGALKQRGLPPNGIVALMADRRLEMIVGIMGILCAGGAYLPLDPTAPLKRRLYMIRDCAAALGLAHEPYIRELEGELQCVDLLSSGPMVDPVVMNDPVAYVIYTSGTTGKPKGTIVEHKSVIRVVKETNYITITPDDRVLQLSNLAFDGSVFDIFGALLNGACLALSPVGASMSLAELGDLIRREAVTLFFITTALFNALLDWDVHCLDGVRHVLFGGEKASPLHCRKGMETLGPGRLINVYGPTETTVYASAYPLAPPLVDGQAVPIGGPISNTALYVLDSLGQPAPIGVPGELYIGGPGLGRGYLNRPELTTEKFVVIEGCGGGRLYRSGDLARWLPGGVIDYLGRIDTQVKIRGFRVETAEIEWALESLLQVREAVVIPFQDHGGTVYLCAYLTTDGDTPSLDELKRQLALQLPEFMIPARFMVLDRLPLNANGKVDQQALPEPVAIDETMVQSPRDALERALLDIWVDVLGLESDKISIHSDFFDLGGHSLKATRLAARLQRDMEADIRLTELFEYPTIAGLAELIRGRRSGASAFFPASEKREYYPLSGAQKRLFLLQCLQPEATAYNVPSVIPFEKGVDERKLENALSLLAKRHASLRTWFRLNGDEPVQAVCPAIEVSLPVTVLPNRSFPFTEMFSRMARPFDLGAPPLWRVHLFRLDNGACYLFWDIHHIITDGVSQGILRRDIEALLRGDETPIPSIDYVDYSLWQEGMWQTEEMRRQEVFWRESFAEVPPALELPSDFSRPLVQEYEGATTAFTLSEEETTLLRQMARESGCTAFMAVMAVFQLLLSLLSRQEDIVVGVPLAGRRLSDLEGIVGMFVNTLAMRFKPKRDKQWAQFLEEVKQGTLRAFDNQDLQFEELVEILDIQRDTGRSPLFDVVFNLLDGGMIGAAGGLKPGVHQPGIAKFDLSLFVVDGGEVLAMGFEYRTRLFSSRTIDAVVGYFKRLIRLAAVEREMTLREFQLMGPEERDVVLRQFNRTEVTLPERLSMGWELYNQSRTRPDRMALSGDGLQLTYEVLNRRVLQLVTVLRQHGVGRDSIVAVHMERSPAMVIAILSVIAAGGAYLALAPENPPERTRFILRDSEARLLLRARCGEKKEGEPLVLGVASEGLFDGTTPCSAPIEHGDEDLFYILYTSGSTGTPKGVMVENLGVVNVMRYLERVFPMGERGVFLFKTNCMFDVSVSELFGWILGAGKVAILPQGYEKDPGLITQAVARERITHIDFVPSMLKVFLDCLEPEEIALLKTLVYVLVGGEEFSRDLADTVLRSGLNVTVANFCGPTETTIYATAYILPRFSQTGPVPIGVPVDNVVHYIVEPDGGNRLVSPLSAGELLVGGVGVGRGYLNRPELTHGRFCDDPFVDGGRMYRSGDLCRWRWSGEVDYLGRMDHQVKIRGFRIELGEIENRLAEHPSIQAAAVTVLESGGSDPAIAAYYIASKDLAPDHEQLKEFIGAMLPSYMVPSYFMALESFPRTGSGKIARRLLPEPIIEAGDGGVVLPTDPFEQELRRLWSDVLGIAEGRVGRDSDFFSLGGHSLKAMVLVSRLKRELGVDVALLDFFAHPTIQGLARVVNCEDVPDILLVHDGTGGVEGYVELCRALDSSFVCRGVTAPAMEELDFHTLEIEDLAQDYVRQSSPLSPKTIIVGWSLGATIAFEMARQLEVSGNGIAALMLIDGLPPRQAWNHREETTLVAEDTQSLLERFPIFRHPPYSDLPASELQGLANRLRALNDARSRYLPETPLATPVVCVCASNSRFVRHQLWSRHVIGNMQFFEIKGDHFSLLRPPAVEELAAYLERLLNNQNI